MYAIAIVRYRRPIEEVEAATPVHRTYLRQLKAEGKLVASGPMDPRYGGIFLLKVSDDNPQRDHDAIRDGDPVLPAAHRAVPSCTAGIWWSWVRTTWTASPRRRPRLRPAPRVELAALTPVRARAQNVTRVTACITCATWAAGSTNCCRCVKTSAPGGARSRTSSPPGTLNGEQPADFHRHGHVPLVMSWAEASRAGLRTMEHIETIFENLQPNLRLTPPRFTELADGLGGALGDEIFGVLKANGAYFDPALVGYEATVESARPEAAAARRQAYARMKPIAARAARLGVPIITGTDVLDRHGDLLLTELERLVEIGMTPRAVLGRDRHVRGRGGRSDAGRLRVGGPASFLLVDANPLEDITALRRLSAVVLRGHYLDAAALRP